MVKSFTIHGQHVSGEVKSDRIYHFLLENVLVIERKDDHWINGTCNYDIAIILNDNKAINILVSEIEYTRVLTNWNKYLKNRKYYYN